MTRLRGYFFAAHLVLAACVLGNYAASAQNSDGAGYFPDWFHRVDATQAAQPHWITPLFTVTPRLEEEFRSDIIGDKQVFVPPGSVAGRFHLWRRLGLSIGAGEQIAVTHYQPVQPRAHAFGAHSLLTGNWVVPDLRHGEARRIVDC